MNESRSNEDRRHVRTSLIASLAFVFTLLASTFALAGGRPPAAETRAAAVPAPAPAASAPAEEATNETPGCGDAESCYATN